MIDKSYADQLKDLFVEATKAIGCQIILGLQTHDKPKDDNDETSYPFVGYNILSSRRVANIPFVESKEIVETTTDPDTEEEVETSIFEFYKTWDEQFEFTLSFVAVDITPFGSVELATKLFNWLSNEGQSFMTVKEIVHVTSTPIVNRDFFLINDYERRNGFDCRLRLGRHVQAKVQDIETVSIDQGTIL